MTIFTWCSAHPAMGGPHASRAIFVRNYFGAPADVVMCTHKSKKGSVCGNEYLVLQEGENDGRR